MPLTHSEILALQPRPKPYKVYIGKGAYILVHPNGSKYWRFRYFLNGKENHYALGVFPDMSIEAAQAARDSASEVVRQGLNPSIARRQAKADARAAQAATSATFRLGLSEDGALTIATGRNAVKLTLPQTRALAAFLNIHNEQEKDSPDAPQGHNGQKRRAES
jgi:hypothetical protein